ncbi:hypothetical protein [Nocardia crassostreae]|uniref:hypothetical protein n=1 Tax=Nocardia crassostreae TaxID=53428 RepID=UPI00082CD931|nr:hypothetical protein [Nocardia crassostreae]
MLSKSTSTTRRTAARVLVAGMLALVPIATVAATASAQNETPPASTVPDPGTDPAIMLLMNQTPPDA